MQPSRRDRIEVTGTMTGQKELGGQVGVHWSHTINEHTSSAVQLQGTPSRFSYAFSLFHALTKSEYFLSFQDMAIR